jgi:hypothetical protein
MVHNILYNWNLSRIIRLGLGIFIIVEGFKTGVWMLIGFGILLSVMPLLNIGCCTTGNCSVPKRKTNESSTTDEVIYKEVK